MKSAKEMFEELGYEIDEENEKEILYKKEWIEMGMETTYWVSFDLRFKLIDYFMVYENTNMSTSHSIDTDLLQAINKQVEELGWK